MLWLIWIAIMLLTPIVAGVSVWHELHHPADDVARTDPLGPEQ